jgi:TPR repeat protein
MFNFGFIRWAALIISVVALPFALFTSLFAPFLLSMGVIWLIALALMFFTENRFDRVSFTISFAALVSVLVVCFIPLWVAEYTAKTPDDFVALAEGFRRRGQILGNRAKTQTYYIKAAEGGSVEAQARVGEAFYFGHYGVTNRREGIRWLKEAASNGHQGSQKLLQSVDLSESN